MNMTLSLIKVTDGEPENTGISRETPRGMVPYDCISCGRQIAIAGINGIVLSAYLRYMDEGGDKCPPCYTGSTLDRERRMNRQDWFNRAPLTDQESSFFDTYPIDGSRESPFAFESDPSPFTILRRQGFGAFFADLWREFLYLNKSYTK